jgi:hypothetical protein
MDATVSFLHALQTAQQLSAEHARGNDGPLVTRRQREYQQKPVVVTAPLTSTPTVSTGKFRFDVSSFNSTDELG